MSQHRKDAVDGCRLQPRLSEPGSGGKEIRHDWIIGGEAPLIAWRSWLSRISDDLQTDKIPSGCPEGRRIHQEWRDQYETLSGVQHVYSRGCNRMSFMRREKGSSSVVGIVVDHGPRTDLSPRLISTGRRDFCLASRRDGKPRANNRIPGSFHVPHGIYFNQ